MNILYINRGMGLGGVEKCIIQLSKLFNNDANKIVVMSMGGELTKELEKIKVKHYSIINTDSKNPLDILKNLITIYRVIKHEKIDIIHSHHRMTTLLAKTISKFIHTRVIHTQHLCIEDKFKLTNLALKNIQTITVSEAAKRILVEKANLDERNITTIYNTVETECSNKIVDDRLLKLKKGGNFVVAQVSRLIDYKGVYDFIEIAKTTCKDNKNIKFILIGDGPEKANLIDIIKRDDLQDQIYVLGPKDNVIEHLKYIDVLLLCSYIEGLPLTPLEAFSQGVPVIATDIDGTNEEIIDKETGYLVKTKDIYSFKQYIVKLYNNKITYNSISNNCMKIFENKFNKEKYEKKHRDLYENIINI